MQDHAQTFERALAAHRAGDLDAAEAAYRAILEVEPEHVDALHFSGLLQHQRGRPQDALDSIWRSLQLAPRYVDAWVNLGGVLVTLQRGEAAERAFREAIEIDPDHAGAWLNLGSVLRRRDEFEGAVFAYTRVVELVPEHPIGWRALAGCLRITGPVDDAIVAHREALRRAPGDLHTMGRLAELLYMAGDRDGAAQVYRDWLAVKPNDPFATHGLAACGGSEIPKRASDAYVKTLFDQFAVDFDEVLVENLEYRAPELLVSVLGEVVGAPSAEQVVADLGCGTGLCGVFLQPFARELVGVDLSEGMLARAKKRDIYDELVVAELTGFLSARPASFDLLASADTLCYFGALEDFARAAFGALRAGGWLGFSVEALEDGDLPFRIRLSGRYEHRASYLQGVLTAAGFAAPILRPVVLRKELGEPVQGWVVVAQRA